jgi:hypothetical protein
MVSKPLSTLSIFRTFVDVYQKDRLAFVTGNANKLREVKEILSSNGDPIEIVSQELDGVSHLLQ